MMLYQLAKIRKRDSAEIAHRSEEEVLGRRNPIKRELCGGSLIGLACGTEAQVLCFCLNKRWRNL